jgi:hypothetical protein
MGSSRVDPLFLSYPLFFGECLLCSRALHRIAVLQDRVLEIFKNSASILKLSAPGCVWRLLRRANAAEWLSHVRL